MARGRFGWERDELFDAKRIRLAESVIETRLGLLIILMGIVFLFIVFFVAPVILFGGLAGLLALIPLMALFGAAAWGSARLLRLREEPHEVPPLQPPAQPGRHTGDDGSQGEEQA